MRTNLYLKLSGSLIAITAATLPPAMAQNAWTGGSSRYITCPVGSVPPCFVTGNNNWNNAANWSMGIPMAGQDVNIGLSTLDPSGIPRPTPHDTVVIGGGNTGNARNLDIGFTGARASTGSFGEGNLTNNGTLNVTANMVVGSTGTGTFTNTGTTTITDSFIVGGGGNGTVDSNGTIAVGGNTVLGQNGSRTGIVTLTGGSLNTAGSMTIGENGMGWLDIGATAVANTTAQVTLGERSTGVGVAIASQGGVMNNGAGLNVGYAGEGYLVVDRGGQVNNTVGTIASENNAMGYAIVTGANSVWDNSDSLTLAGERDAQGVLVINDDGTVRIDGGDGTLRIADQAGSTGILNIGAMSPTGDDYGVHADVDAYLTGGAVAGLPAGSGAADPAARAPGTLDAQWVEFGGGDGVVNFDHTGDAALDYRFKAGFVNGEVGRTELNHYAGFTVLDGDSSLYEGAADVLGGILVVNNKLAAGDLQVHAGGTLRIGHEGGTQPGDGTTGEVLVDITNDGLVEFNRSNTYTYFSKISGTGDVEQDGSGTTILTGENTYTGSTILNDGTLQLGDGGTSGSIDATAGIQINAPATLAFDRSDIKAIDRLISGDGFIEQNGTGTTRLTANNAAFTGQTDVNAGTLSINGTLGGVTHVNNGGTLEGLGNGGDTMVHTGGTIAPGNHDAADTIGTFRVASLVQEAGSTFEAEVRSNGDGDLLLVSGTSVIDDGALLNVSKLDAPRYELEHRYTVQTAVGGLTGRYTLTGDTEVSTFYQVEDMYDANNVYLVVNQHRQFNEAAWTVNETAAATAAQELKSQRAGNAPHFYPTNELFRAIAYLQTDGEARDAFNQISGEIYASNQGALLENSRFVREATGNRLRGAFGGTGKSSKVMAYEPRTDVKDPSPRTVWVDADEVQDGVVLWGAGYGGWGEVDGDGNASEFQNGTGGFIGGADILLFDRFRVGVAGGYGRSEYDVHALSSSASSDDYHLGLYGGAEWGRIGLRLGANYTWHKMKTERKIDFPGYTDVLAAEYNASTTQVHGDVGYSLNLGRFDVEPFAGLAYVNVDQDDYRESGRAAALRGSDDSMNAFYGTLGLRVAREFDFDDMKTTVNGMVGWRHAFNDELASSTHSFDGSSAFTVYGAPISQDAAIVEVGFETKVNKEFSVGLSYSGLFGESHKSHGLHGSASWKF